jgi:aspartyl-tRNA(Asn)/glutamyl-tRNA(Gln) amidotransferase subunit C
MAVDAEDIRWVAHLARLEFDESEIGLFTEQFNNILSYVDQLKAVDTTGVEPLAHALPDHNVFREDTATPSLSLDEALLNAPARKGDLYSVPAVLD